MGNTPRKKNKKKAKDENEYRPKNTYYANREGQKKDMKLVGQDVPQMMSFEVDGSFVKFIAVFDGHGEKGRTAADYVARSVDNFLQMNKKDLKKWNSKEIVTKKFVELFKSTQKKMIKEPENFEQSGTCAVCSFIVDRNCFVINLGDSRCVIGSKSGETKYAIQMSNDHKPNDPEEESRVKKCRGEVTNYRDHNYGPYRIYREGENVPGLAVSRSLGDLIGHEVGVSEIPEISIKAIDPQDEFIVVGSDGIFDVMNSAELVGFIFEKLEDIEREKIADEVVDECRKRWNVINKHKDEVLNEKNKELSNQKENKDNPASGTKDTQNKHDINQPGPYTPKDVLGQNQGQAVGSPTAVFHSYHNNIDDITCVIHFFK